MRRVVSILVALAASQAMAFAPPGRVVHYTPVTGPTSNRTLRLDADALVRLGFRTVIVAAEHPQAARVARRFARQGFQAVVATIDDPRDRRLARIARRLDAHVTAFAVGRDGLGDQHYTRGQLTAAIATLRAVGRPVGTRERPETYHRDLALASAGDWILAARPIEGREGINPQVLCGHIASAFHALRAVVPDRPIVIDEVGLPTAGVPGANEHYQRAFYACVESRSGWIGYAQGVDRGEDTRGVLRANGTPKLWARGEAPPAITLTLDGTLPPSGRIEHAARERFAVVLYRLTDAWTASPVIIPDRRGVWRATDGSSAPTAVLLVARGYEPPAHTMKLPQADGEQVFAVAPTRPPRAPAPPEPRTDASAAHP